MIRVMVAPADCWDCGCEMRIVSMVEICSGGTCVQCSISDFTAHPDLLEVIEQNLTGDAGVGALKSRYSRTLERPYASNGCVHCDALFGQHFEVQTRYAEVLAAEFAAPTSLSWGRMFRELKQSEDGHLFH